MAIIAVDGPTGVGKSTTARALADALDARLLLDPVSVSPLLDDYYTGEAAPAAALSAELAFLRSRAGLLASASSGELVVADFSVMRTAPFAEFLEDPDDRAVVLRELDQLIAAGPRPTLLVLLSADPSTLLDRVRVRDRAAESDLTIEHLIALRGHFETWRTRITDHVDHVIEIDTANWDPRRPDDLAELIERIRSALHRVD